MESYHLLQLTETSKSFKSKLAPVRQMTPFLKGKVMTGVQDWDAFAAASVFTQGLKQALLVSLFQSFPCVKCNNDPFFCLTTSL